MVYKIMDILFILFTRWESHAKGGQADVFPPLAEYAISFVACPGEALAKSDQGIAVG